MNRQTDWLKSMEERHFPDDRERREAIVLLHAERCSCVICKDGRMRTFRERGVKDLYRLLKEEPEFLRGAFVADKVVGKAAASLMILGGISGLHADVASEPAMSLLKNCGVDAECTECVPHVINRSGTDWCPLEKRCFGLETPQECLASIEEFLAGLGK